MYLLNVQRICAEKAEAAGQAEAWETALRGMDPAEAGKDSPHGQGPEVQGKQLEETEGEKLG